jgi:hypothetical protein
MGVKGLFLLLKRAFLLLMPLFSPKICLPSGPTTLGFAKEGPENRKGLA